MEDFASLENLGSFDSNKSIPDLITKLKKTSQFEVLVNVFISI